MPNSITQDVPPGGERIATTAAAATATAAEATSTPGASSLNVEAPASQPPAPLLPAQEVAGALEQRQRQSQKRTRDERSPEARGDQTASQEPQEPPAATVEQFVSRQDLRDSETRILDQIREMLSQQGNSETPVADAACYPG